MQNDDESYHENHTFQFMKCLKAKVLHRNPSTNLTVKRDRVLGFQGVSFYFAFMYTIALTKRWTYIYFFPEEGYILECTYYFTFFFLFFLRKSEPTW